MPRARKLRLTAAWTTRSASDIDTTLARPPQGKPHGPAATDQDDGAIRFPGSPSGWTTAIIESPGTGGEEVTEAEDALRIAIVAPPWYPLPPSGYGGTELVVHLL